MSLIVKGSPADLLLAELRESLRKTEFQVAIAREMVPVVGVFFFGWVALEAAVFFLFESWLFLTVRCTLDIFHDPSFNDRGKSGSAVASLFKFIGYLATAGLVFGLMIGTFSFLAVMRVFSPEDRLAFLEGGFAERHFLVGIGLLVASELYSGWRFAASLATRSKEERERDDHRIMVMFYRCIALFAAAMALGYLTDFGLPSQIFVIGIALVALAFEAFPRHLQQRFARLKPRGAAKRR